MNKLSTMIVPAMLLAYMYFVYSKTQPAPVGDDSHDEGTMCPNCPINKKTPTATIAPPSEHCGEDLRGLDVKHPDDAVIAYQRQQEDFARRKLTNPELVPVLRSIASRS